MSSSREPTYSEKFFVVGVGASAGGLEAIGDLISELPPHIPAAIIIAQHLAPNANSLMVELLAPRAILPVLPAEHLKKIERGNIYITPPGFDIEIVSGKILLNPTDEETRSKPSVNRLFSSIAYACGETSVGIILSGTGNDGADGMRVIHSVGGLTIVQAPDTAKFDGMPESSIETGVIDYILAPTEISAKLPELIQRHHLRAPLDM